MVPEEEERMDTQPEEQKLELAAERLSRTIADLDGLKRPNEERSLMQRRKQRHDACVADFEARARELNIELENAIERACVDLKVALALGHKKTDMTLRDGFADIGTLVDERLSDSEPNPMEQEGLQQLGLTTDWEGVTMRRRRVLLVKGRLLRLRAQLADLATERLNNISEFCVIISDVDLRRRDELSRFIRELLDKLRAISWEGEEGIAALAQLKGTEINLCVAANKRTIVSLVARLLRREADEQRELEDEFSSRWGETLDKMSDSAIAHTLARVRSDTYRDPPSRRALVSALVGELVGVPLRDALLQARPQSGKSSADITGSNITQRVQEGLRHTAMKFAACGEPLVLPAPSGTFCAARPGAVQRGVPVPECRPVVVAEEDRDGLFTVDTVGPIVEQWREVEPSRLQAVSPQLGRWEGKQLGGLLGVLHRHLAALARMCLSLTQVPQSSSSSIFPSVGGAIPGGWLDGWNPPSPPTKQQLQIGGEAGTVVTEPQPEGACAASEQVDEWKRSLRLFVTRIKSLNAEYAARAQQQEEELVAEAEREAWLLHTDIELIYNHQPPVPGLAKVEGEAAEAEQGVLCALRSVDPEVDEARYAELLIAMTEQSSMVSLGCMQAAESLASHLALPTYVNVLPIAAPSRPPSAQGGRSPTKGDALGDRMNAETQRAEGALQPQLAQLRAESKEFLDVLGQQMQEQFALLHDECISSVSSLLPVFRGAASFIEKAAARLATEQWRHRAQLLEAELSFTDAHNSREQRFRNQVVAVLHGASREEATDFFAEALDTLHEIESGYHSTFKEREQMLSDYMPAVLAAVSEVRQDLFTALSVATPEQVEEMLQAAAPPPVEEAPQAGKKKGKAAEPVAEETPKEPAVVVRQGCRVWSPWGELAELGQGAAELKLGETDTEIDPRPEVPTLDKPPPSAHTEADDMKRAGSVADAKAAKGKGKGKDPAAEEKDAEAEAEALRLQREKEEASRELRRRTEHQVLPYLPRDMFVPVDEGLSEGLRVNVLRVLRQQLLLWLHGLGSAVQEEARRSCVTESKRLQEWLSERLRLHQRRAPNLESDEYNRRLRQLVETSEMRDREFAAIEARFEQCLSQCQGEVDAWQSGFEHDYGVLQERRAALPTAPTLAALATHDRAARALNDQMQQNASKAAERVLALYDQAEATLVKEAQRFLRENAKSFGEHGSMCEEEIQATVDAVGESEKKAKATVEEMKKDVQDRAEKQIEMLEAEAAKYQGALAESHDDLDFLRQIGEKVSMAKQVLMGHLSKSVVQEREIEEMTEAFESRLKRVTPRTTAKSYTEFIAAEPDLSVKRAGSSDTFAEFRAGRAAEAMPLPEDQQLEPVDAQMAGVLRLISSKLLRQAKLKRESLLQASSAQQLMQLMDDLRRILYSRGLFLAALKFALPFKEVGFISPKQYLEPRSGGAPEGGAAPAEGAAAGGRPPSGKGKKPDPKAAEQQAQASKLQEEADAWQDFLKVEPWNREAAKATSACKRDCEPIITAYYQKKGERPVTRPDLLAATADSFRTWLGKRLEEHEAALCDHVDSVLETYKRQVTRVFLAAQRLPQEIFSLLYNLCFLDLADTTAACKAVFEAHYSESMRLKRLHGEKVKCSMTNPANRSELVKTEVAEEGRHKCSALMVRTFHKLLLREESEEGVRFRARCVQTTQTIFKLLQTLVTPDIVTSKSEVIVGKHRSLKRLKKAQVRDQGQADQDAAESAVQVKGGKGKKEEAKPPPKSGGKQKGGAGKEEAPAETVLPMLEKPTVPYPGLLHHAFRLYEDHDKKDPDICLMPAKGRKEEADAAAAAAAAAVPAKGKPAPKKASPAAAPAKGDAGKKPDAGGEFEEDAVTDGVVGWREAAFKSTIYYRGQSFEAYRQHYTRRCGGVDELFQGLLAKETSWNSSWSKLVDNLHPERQVAEG
eukprot:Hpha_TRINITY_DN16312_c1_g15::TRINITY_DN16312_c1_g15_i1::g.59656::m.59656